MDPSYNNSFGMPGQQPIVSSGGGEVFFNGAEKKKKKSFVVFITLFVVFAMIGVGTFFLISSLQQSNKYIDYFNDYANYLLYGDSKKDNVGDFSAYGTYYIDDNYTNNEYLNELRSKYAVFYDAIKEKGIIENTELSVVFGDIDSLVAYNSLKLLDDEYIISLFDSEGKDAALKAVSSFYNIASLNDIDMNEDYVNETNPFTKRIKEYDVIRAMQKIGFLSGENDDYDMISAEDYAKKSAYEVRISLKKQTSIINKALAGDESND